MKSSIQVIEPSSLDFSCLVKLQKVAFSEIMRKTETHYLFNEPYYRWKYYPPAGSARIALLYDAKGLAAAKSMYPLDVVASDDRLRAWQSCDAATHPRSRGKGYFTKCIQALNSELGPEDLLFGYPNKNSIPGLRKVGWTSRDNIRTWLRILPGGKTSQFPFIYQMEQFTKEQDDFSKKLVARGVVMLDRSAQYMNWRYKYHPFHQYEIFGWREQQQLVGVMVIRRARIAGKELVIVMETLALSNSVERGLLAFAAAWARESRVFYTLALNNTIKILNGFRSCYLPIPMRALPKQQVLMGITNSSKAKRVWEMPWHIQIGDWDAF